MKKKFSLNIVIFIFTLFFLQSCKKVEKKIDNMTRLTEVGNVFYLERTPFSGEVLDNKDVLHFKDGKLNGEIKKYHKNGKLKAIETWKDGFLNGKFKIFDEKEVKIMDVEYKRGKNNGKFDIYYPNGKRRIKGYYKDGIPRGVWEYYDKKGVLIGKANEG